MSTRLDLLHPYPAMFAAELAVDLADRHVKPGFHVLDPFCGTGRVLTAAAEMGAAVYGIDVNPLACLISEAKLSSASHEELWRVLNMLGSGQGPVPASSCSYREKRRVPWFDEHVHRELLGIAGWIGELELQRAEQLVLVVLLSATARFCSYVRKEGWKLHRMAEDLRSGPRWSATVELARRLRRYLAQPAAPVDWRYQIVNGDCRSVLSEPREWPKFDLVITSPPYGDSKTTVQYGAASGLLLDVVTHIPGFESYFMAGNDIDRACLGGGRVAGGGEAANLESYWAGDFRGRGGARVSAFLVDIQDSLVRFVDVLARGGIIVLVVGRRKVGGYELALDDVVLDTARDLGLVCVEAYSRPLFGKRGPRWVNRFGRLRSSLSCNGTMETMVEERILVFRSTR